MPPYDMTKLEKLDWIQCLLDKLSQSKSILPEDIQKAREFIENIRESYIQDFK